MKPWQFAVVSLALLATAGCRSDPAVPILERELRHKEDEIYRLRAQLEEFQDCCTCQDVAAGGPRPAPAGPNGTPHGHPAAPGGIAPPSIELPGQPSSSVPDALKAPTPGGSAPAGVPEVPESLRGPSKPLSPKDLELPTKPTSRNRLPAPLDSDGLALERGPAGTGSRSGRVKLASFSESGQPLAPAGDSRRVQSITLNRTLTGSILGDDHIGDQGLLVVVEPRDADGRTVDAPAEINVAVLDPALRDEACRVARWDFTPAETAALFRRGGSGQAIHLAVAWPAKRPVHRKLHLFVRYMTADGRQLKTDQPIEVVLPGDQADHGTTADTPANGRSPHAAARGDESAPQRPIWSPDRR
jgi:hypothetical protein